MQSFLPFQSGFRLFDGQSLNAALTAVQAIQWPGNVWYVAPASASRTVRSGRSWSSASATVQGAINAAASGDLILIAEGSYDEAITTDRTKGVDGLTIVGVGATGSVGIAPSGTNDVALTNDLDDVTLVNVGLAGLGTGSGLINTGARFNAQGCKLENDDGTGYCARMTLGTVAQRAAHTKGGGADFKITNCEFAWAANGVLLTGTDYGAVTQGAIRASRFHNLATSSLVESVGSGGSAAVTFRNILVEGCTFEPAEDGTVPTKWFSLNASNSNTGLVTGNYMPSAANSGKNLVSTAMLWVGNFIPAGLSAGQPS